MKQTVKREEVVQWLETKGVWKKRSGGDEGGRGDEDTFGVTCRSTEQLNGLGQKGQRKGISDYQSAKGGTDVESIQKKLGQGEISGTRKRDVRITNSLPCEIQLRLPETERPTSD
ncbi:hypothetical protein T265_02118 [Opisthorchis viverrini]|uniref:Uncharacterized protein n=1 Tax=Opisthorchis viverrini TaxID=6198 RepID=A0A074ZWD0_OPIVI|nr:hypothetical protein T265_02118 [Opisthorchis viverrini]KER31758.1 hypothetical protein T265_02118 [Opisthorchis viverrini]